MSIVKMQRIAVIGMDGCKKQLLSHLMEFGAVELTEQSSKLTEEVWKNNTRIEENREEITRLEGKINQAVMALETIEKYGRLKSPLFATRRSVAKAQAESAAADLGSYEQKAEFILKLDDRITELNEEMNKLNQDEAALLPWSNYDVPLECTGTRTTKIDTGVLPAGSDLDSLGKELDQLNQVIFSPVGSDRDLYYVAVISDNQIHDDVLAILKQSGFSQMSFKDFKGTVRENLIRIQGERDVLKVELEKAADEVAANAGLKPDIEMYHDILTVSLDKQKIESKLLKTKRTFFIEGWIPARCVKQAEEILDENQCCYSFRDPQEDEEVPVALDNKSFFVPFESITEMYSLPDYKGFDPTSIFALFYAIFFGMMLSDAGYGIVMAAGCFIALKKYDLEGNTYKMIKLFFYCGISTTFWGAMFGGWFGDFVQVFSRTILGKEIAVNPIWFNPIEDPMTLLIFSLGLGVIHIFIGMGIKAYMQIKDGHLFDAICDEGFWYLTILGLIGWLAGSSFGAAVVTIGKWMAIVGVAGLLLTGGRDKKGFGKVIGGLGSVYNITSYLSDILSYARLLALGLATGVIAQVVNTMGAMGGGGVKGCIILLIAFVLGHTLNLAINALGAFIHASRLQYIEFFGKFYEDGGEPFDPFRKKTKYIKIADK